MVKLNDILGAEASKFNERIEQNAIRPVKWYSSRTAAVAAATEGTWSVGAMIGVGPTLWAYDGASTAISDMLGWVPVWPTSPLHFPGDVSASLQIAASYCAENAAALYLSSGVYNLTTQISVNAPLVVFGDGVSNTELRWASDASGYGFSITSGSINRMTQFENMSLTNGSTGSGTAISIDYSGLISGGVIYPRANSHLKMRNVTIQGSDKTSGTGWLNGVDAKSLMNFDVDGCRINGYYGVPYGSMPVANSAIRFYGDGSPVQIFIDRSSISGFQYAVWTSDVEGIYINNSEMVTVGCGFKCSNSSGESGVFLTNNHIAFIDTAISLNNIGDGLVKGNLFYGVNNATPLTGIVCSGSTKNLDISGNIFRNLVTGSTSWTGINLTSGQDILIGENIFVLSSSDVPISIASGVLRTRIRRQQYVGSPSGNQIQNSSTTTQSEEFRGYAGSCDSIYTDWRMPKQIHILSSAATGYPSSWSVPTGGIIETTSVDVNTAYQTARNPNLGSSEYKRAKASGTWGAWS